MSETSGLTQAELYGLLTERSDFMLALAHTALFGGPRMAGFGVVRGRFDLNVGNITLGREETCDLAEMVRRVTTSHEGRLEMIVHAHGDREAAYDGTTTLPTRADIIFDQQTRAETGSPYMISGVLSHSGSDRGRLV